MTRVASEKQYNSFVKGLITEASPLTFPENAFLDGDNILLRRDGSFSRRLGIDYEDGYSLIDTGISVGILEVEKSFHKWNFAGGDPNISLGVIRVSNKLYFLDMTSVSPSGTLKNGGNPIVIAGLGDSPIEASIVNGGLVIVSAALFSPIFLEYDSASDTITQTDISVKVRDFWGVDDGEIVDVRPTTLSAKHKYNLLNQGWVQIDIDSLFNKKDVYPSNADIWSFGKKATDEFSATYLIRNSKDNSQAPRGRYVIDLYNRGDSRIAESKVTGLDLDKESGRISSVATYAGRIFYTGILSQTTGGDKRSPAYGGYIFFSKTVAAKDDLGKCYSEADPTSEYISDIIDTDGGTINILEANKIISLVSSKNSLVVFAENGIWEIYGGDVGFKATEYQLSKITNIGISDSRSIIVAGDNILYWNNKGIYLLSPEATSGKLNVQNISLPTIQGFYDNIPSGAKENALGFYDEGGNTVRWLYTQGNYTRELVLDLSLQAFYTNSVSLNNVALVDYVEIPNFVKSQNIEDVYVGGDQVFVGTDAVQVTSIENQDRDSAFAFLVFKTDGNFTLGKYSDNTFKDWVVAEAGGVDYSSYIVTGYEIFGDIMRKKQATYLVMMMERTEDGFSLSGTDLIADNQSSCLIQAQWNWTNSSASNKWGNAFQAYRYIRPYNPSGVGDDYNTGDRVVVTKNKLRGSGRALSLYIHSESGKDMKVLGWAIPMTGNGTA